MADQQRARVDRMALEKDALQKAMNVKEMMTLRNERSLRQQVCSNAVLHLCSHFGVYSIVSQAVVLMIKVMEDRANRTVSRCKALFHWDSNAKRAHLNNSRLQNHEYADLAIERWLELPRVCLFCVHLGRERVCCRAHLASLLPFSTCFYPLILYESRPKLSNYRITHVQPIFTRFCHEFMTPLHHF